MVTLLAGPEVLKQFHVSRVVIGWNNEVKHTLLESRFLLRGAIHYYRIDFGFLGNLCKQEYLLDLSCYVSLVLCVSGEKYCTKLPDFVELYEACHLTCF